MKDLYIVEKTVRIDICLYEAMIEGVAEYHGTTNFQEIIFSAVEDENIPYSIHIYFESFYGTDIWDMTPDFLNNSSIDLRNIIKINEKEFRKDGIDEDEPIGHLLFDVKFKCFESHTNKIDFTDSMWDEWRLYTVKMTQIDESKEKLINLNQLGESYWRDTGVYEYDYRNNNLEKFIDDTYKEYFN